MAYYAELDGVSGLAQCASALSLPSDFEINYDLFILEDGNDDYFSAPFNGRGIGFLSSFIAFFESSQQVYFSYPSTGKPAINDVVNIRFTSTGNGDGTFTIRCYMSVNGGEEEQLSKVVGDDVFSQPLSPRPMEWGRRPNTLYRKVGVIRTRYYESGVIQNDWDFNQSSGITAPDLVGSNPATLSGGFTWVFYDDGSEPEPELHEFSGNAIVSALSFAQISKITQHNGQALITASAAASSTKAISVSGGSTVIAQSVSLFEKLNTFNGAASVITTSQSSASKLVPFNGQATVSVTANASIIDGDLEIHSFSGGALITASASGQALKVGLVSGQSTTHASASGQASKVAHVEGSATVTTSTQSAISKIASVFGEAISHITASAIAAKRVVLSGASTVITTVYGQFFNTDSNVDTYQTIVQGRVKTNPEVQGRVRANPEIEGTVKSTTIQGRVK